MAHGIGSVHRMQVQIAARNRVVASGHGKRSLIDSRAPADKVICSAPRTEPDGDPVQAFVAHATAMGDDPRQRSFGDWGTGWPRNCVCDDVREVPVCALIPGPDFLSRRGGNRGMTFRGGRFGISAANDRRRARALGVV